MPPAGGDHRRSYERGAREPEEEVLAAVAHSVVRPRREHDVTRRPVGGRRLARSACSAASDVLDDVGEVGKLDIAGVDDGLLDRLYACRVEARDLVD